MLKTLLVLALSASALAADAFPVFNKRQTVPIPCSESGRKACGDGCIPLTYTCCPDQQGGCPLSSTCWLGTNGAYGCCPIGRRCTGPGGVDTQPGSTVTSTIFSTESVPDEETSTSFFVSTSTPVITFTSEESTSTETRFVPEPTTSTSLPSASNTRTTTFAAPTATPNSTSTRAPPVTVNGANSRSGSLLQAVAAGAVALLAI
ncbi:GPI anchored serine-threonine rich protein [Colletotrichum tofieldiae]|uniref:GPI anchored serine-threonine rich protein n=1 Tax=Colletotrichum tofieldiae TaxID=708197 RepID=A0A166Q842_9PEZI|nr:GPI anchored serine-threonine rich protein [Colletotrichum tofieldiae]GKT59800.1 GPI anchored serine-threonine rich protein [Colletotrichum tofieldiae]GKT78596.1 GPI anchored serine-threonine rich protein [Colletotrichum tofieldiae]GKT85977.1 GPI anchored serine-threonine rich protein [Colletotrichum tofieldiae]